VHYLRTLGVIYENPVSGKKNAKDGMQDVLVALYMKKGRTTKREEHGLRGHFFGRNNSRLSYLITKEA